MAKFVSHANQPSPNKSRIAFGIEHRAPSVKPSIMSPGPLMKIFKLIKYSAINITPLLTLQIF